MINVESTKLLYANQLDHHQVMREQQSMRKLDDYQQLVLTNRKDLSGDLPNLPISRDEVPMSSCSTMNLG